MRKRIFCLLKRIPMIFCGKTMVGGAVALAGLVASFPTHAQEHASGKTGLETVIKVNPKQERGAISPSIYGSCQEFINNSSGLWGKEDVNTPHGLWDAANKRINPNFDRNHRESGLKSLRYPGGTPASTFEWKKAIGPVEKRHKMLLPYANSTSQVATFGLDEVARWCEESGVEMIYMYGIGAPNSNPQDAADLVEYLNAPVGQNPNGGVEWANVRARNGHSKPYNIRSFEIANEADGPNPQQRFWLNAVDTDENRAKRTLPMYPQRQSYAPEYCFGGIIKYENQPLILPDDLRASAGKSDGKPGQQKVTRYYPFVPNSDSVMVDGQAWRWVTDLQKASGKVYHSDPTTGLVSFGDGIHGDIPPQGVDLMVSYRAPRAGFVDYYAAMKAIDSRILIYAGYESSNIITTMSDKHPYDGIVIHPYTNQWNVPKAVTLDEWHHNLMLSSARLGNEIQEYQQLIDRTVAPARRGKVKVVCSEYGPLHQDKVLPDGTTGSSNRFWSVGLYTGAQFLEWMRAGLPHAQRYSTIGGMFSLGPDFELTGAGEVSKFFTHHFGDRLVGITIENNPLRPTDKVLSGNNFYGNITRVDTPNAPLGTALLNLPRLNAEASHDAQGNVYVIVINQDATEAATANLQIVGLKGKGETEVWTLRGEAPNAFNAPASTHAVKHERTRQTWDNAGLRHTFAPLSVTAIKLRSDCF